ncbi:MAG: sensor domain-containing diguanylate cyclase [Gammaproteobacteria bacterium]|nr:sensor domain-containing diguanylate cyclase [Gammaproteobacteria bacterium]
MSKEQELRKKLAEVLTEAAKNETILRRAQEREQVLLESASLQELFHNMISGLRDSFGLDAISVVLWDPHHEVRHLLLFDDIEYTVPEGVIFCEDLSELSPVFHNIKGPALGPYLPDKHARFFATDAPVASIAILPLRRNNRVIGSLNLGSANIKRFTRYHAADFLAHLAVIAAFCLENNINRARLIWTGLTDVLTGWHNRRYLEARMPEELAAASRSGEPLALLMFDLDHFKRINDTYGHAAGDRVLREVAQRIQRVIRISDVASRYGGEEFIVMLPRTDISEAAALAERIRQAVSEFPLRVTDQTAVTITVSIGVSCAMPAPKSGDFDLQLQQLIDMADKAMYQAKKNGRDQVALAT